MESRGEALAESVDCVMELGGGPDDTPAEAAEVVLLPRQRPNEEVRTRLTAGDGVGTGCGGAAWLLTQPLPPQPVPPLPMGNGRADRGTAPPTLPSETSTASEQAVAFAASSSLAASSAATALYASTCAIASAASTCDDQGTGGVWRTMDRRWATR